MTQVLIGDPITPEVILVGEPIMFNATLGQAGLWTGHGVPGTIVGAAIGDEYLDFDTGLVYRLNPGG